MRPVRARLGRSRFASARLARTAGLPLPSLSPVPMSKTDWAVLGLNALTLLAAVVGLMANQTDPMGYGLMLAFAATTVNSVLLLRRASGRSETAAPATRDSLDAHELLDIDARLEALERGDARTLQALADQGVVRGPASDGGEAARVQAGQPLTNGR